MARIVIGLGTSHTPLVATEAPMWEQRAISDRTNPELYDAQGELRTYDEPASTMLRRRFLRTRIGNMIAPGGIAGLDTTTGKIPGDLERRLGAMFANVRKIFEAGGGTAEDILKMTIWARHRAARSIMDPHWTKMFPDPHTRPARHTLVYQLPDPMVVQCDVE